MKEALKLALEALEDSEDHLAKPYSTDARRAIAAIKAALAQDEQGEYQRGYADAMNWKVQNHLEHLPQRPVAEPHKPLTRGQIREIEVDVSLNLSFDYITPAEQLCRAIEAAHGIKE